MGRDHNLVRKNDRAVRPARTDEAMLAVAKIEPSMPVGNRGRGSTAWSSASSHQG
jgi:hypothetical protein